MADFVVFQFQLHFATDAVHIDFSFFSKITLGNHGPKRKRRDTVAQAVMQLRNKSPRLAVLKHVFYGVSAVER